jgi:plastocyanin
MSNLKENDTSARRAPSMEINRRLGLVAGLLIVLALLVAACGSAAEPTVAPTAVPTAEPTSAAEPTVVPTAVPTVVPTSAPAPTDTPVAETTITPSVTVADQEIVEDKVIIAEVVSDGPGWLVIHAEADGKPGPILGYSAVASGVNADVMVEIDTSSATETLYAMLHTDAGELGTWEFPNGPDVPVTVDEQVVTPAFKVSQQAAASQSTPTTVATAPSNAGSEIPAGAVVVTGDEAEVEMEDFEFNPPILVIRPGTTVKFANKDDVQHTATSDTGVFDSGYLSKGEEYSYIFTEPGTYPYYCIPHGGPGGQGMAATIIVQP